MLPKLAGIYKICCAANEKIYVGSSANIYRRWYSRHLSQLRSGSHVNPHLQAAWVKYGESTFTCEVIELCDQQQLLEKEQYWIDTLNCAATGFNICATAGNTRGVPQSPKCKAAILAAKSKTYIVTNPDGFSQVITNLYAFCRDNELTHNAMSRVAGGKARHHKRWLCRYASQTSTEWEATIIAPASRPIKVLNNKIWCSKCRKYKDRQHFNKDKQQPAGFAAYCRRCNCDRKKAQYSKCKESA